MTTQLQNTYKSKLYTLIPERDDYKYVKAAMQVCVGEHDIYFSGEAKSKDVRDMIELIELTSSELALRKLLEDQSLYTVAVDVREWDPEYDFQFIDSRLPFKISYGFIFQNGLVMWFMRPYTYNSFTFTSADG